MPLSIIEIKGLWYLTFLDRWKTITEMISFPNHTIMAKLKGFFLRLQPKHGLFDGKVITFSVLLDYPLS